VPSVEIRPVREEDLPVIDATMNEGWPYGRPLALHTGRLEMQKAGRAIYLFAWDGTQPVGHVLLTLQGPDEESGQVRSAHISDLFVIPPFWSRGIGTLLMDRCEAIAAEHGCEQVGLSVAVDNPRAIELYERRGYKDPGLERRQARWSYLRPDGTEGFREDVMIYLLKKLLT
jgi:ribosomal protein S18 acetylase RimI-like enzyme